MGAAWHRARLDEVDWVPVVAHPGIHTAFLGEDVETGPWMMHVRFEPHATVSAHWHSRDTIYVVTAGEVTFGEEGTYRAGDVRWIRAGTFYGPEAAGPEGCEFLLVSSGGPSEMHYDEASATRTGAVRGG